MVTRYNPDTDEYEIDPSSLAMSDVDPYFDPVLGDIDPLNEHKGVGGGAGDNSYSSVGVDPSTLWDPTKGVNWESLKKFITSPAGIAGLGGAALGYLDRAKPTGGGTTMAYPGAMDLSRTMVQGKYGPIAEYKSSYYTGAPDYRDFKSPTFPGLVGTPAPAPEPAAPGRTVESKVAEYKRLSSYGLSDERIRRIAEVMYGPQTDSDWAELKRLAGVSTEGGIKTPSPTPAPKPAEPKVTLPYDPEMSIPVGTAAEQFANIGKTMPANWETTKDPLERIRTLNSMGVTSDQLKSLGYSPADISWMESKGFGSDGTKTKGGDSNITDTISKMVKERFPNYNPNKMTMDYDEADAYRDELIRTMGGGGDRATKTDAERASSASAAQGIASLAQEDPFMAAIRQAVTTPQAQTPIYKDLNSDSTLSVKKDYLGQPLEFTFTDKYGKSETVGTSNTTLINELAQKYGIDLTRAFGAGTSATGGGLPWYGAQGNAADTQKYANVGSFTPGAPQQMVYSPEDKGLVFQPIQTGQDLGTQVSAFASKPFTELENTLKKFKQTPPKTQEELVAANSAWLDYQNRFANSSVATQPGRYDSSLKPISMVAQTYNEYGPLNQAMTSLSQKASEGTSQSLTGSPFAGGEAQQLNQTIAALGANPLVQQTLDKISAVDPNAKFSTDDATRLAGQIQELGAENAISNFIRDKQNLIGIGTNNWQSRLNVQDPTYASYQNLLNNIGGLYAQPTRKLAQGGAVQMEDGGFVMTKRAVDGAGGPPGIRRLLPDARMIRGPGHGTSDSISAVINGRNGQTPARLSNGEAYVPPGRDTKALYALMNQLERKA